MRILFFSILDRLFMALRLTALLGVTHRIFIAVWNSDNTSAWSPLHFLYDADSQSPLSWNPVTFSARVQLSILGFSHRNRQPRNNSRGSSASLGHSYCNRIIWISWEIRLHPLADSYRNDLALENPVHTNYVLAKFS
jgi:hypothetical protein